MPVVEITKQIDAPTSEVWAFISDIRKAPQWVTVMQELIKTSENPVQHGTIYHERSKIGPNESETEWKVTVFEPQDVQVHECAEPSFQAKLTMRVEPANEGARLIHRTEYQLMPVFRPLGWLLEKLFIEDTMKRNLQTTVENAKSMIENSN